MNALLRSELTKLRSTSGIAGLSLAMVSLVLFVVLLHAVGLPARSISGRFDQLMAVFGWAELFGALFGALLGALCITGEYRYGTIRSTLFATPRRGRVMQAKLAASGLIGACLGVLAATIAIVVGAAVLSARGIELTLHARDYAWIGLGGGVASALWAAIGVGIGALLRNQVPVVTGLCAWLLFVETVLLGDANIIGSVGGFTPGALARATAGQHEQVGPLTGLLLLTAYAAAAAAAGTIATIRRDVP